MVKPRIHEAKFNQTPKAENLIEQQLDTPKVGQYFDEAAYEATQVHKGTTFSSAERGQTQIVSAEGCFDSKTLAATPASTKYNTDTSAFGVQSLSGQTSMP